jgi:ComF family protein
MIETNLIKTLGRRVIDALLPQRCIGCGAIIETGADTGGAVCASCWNDLHFLAPPSCACCGIPFPYDLPDDTLCAACTAHPPAFDRARAALRYDDACRPLVTRFKYADQTDRAPAFGRMLMRIAAPLLAEADVIAPVPLHRWRLVSRRYNQSALLASALAKAAGREIEPDLMQRRRSTRPQVGMSARARRRNVSGAFAVRPAKLDLVKDRRILLVDDVFTTGATVEECAKVLRRAGAAGVDVVTLARVVRPQDGDVETDF